VHGKTLDIVVVTQEELLFVVVDIQHNAKPSCKIYNVSVTVVEQI
jgi:hypothetical protein